MLSQMNYLLIHAPCCVTTCPWHPIRAEKKKGQLLGWGVGLNKKAAPELRLEEGWISSMGKGVK